MNLNYSDILDYADAMYPGVKVYQLEAKQVSTDKQGTKVFAHDVWVPIDKLIDTVRDAISGKPSYTPKKLAEIPEKLKNGKSG